jgi:hypothetical protein
MYEVWTLTPARKGENRRKLVRLFPNLRPSVLDHNTMEHKFFALNALYRIMLKSTSKVDYGVFTTRTTDASYAIAFGNVNRNGKSVSIRDKDGKLRKLSLPQFRLYLNNWQPKNKVNNDIRLL